MDKIKRSSLLAMAGVILISLLFGTPNAEAAHCPPQQGACGCGRTDPGPHPSAHLGFYWICEWPDGCHHVCYHERGDAVPDACEASGSIVAVENQILSESVQIVGTPFRLFYHSDRVPGRTDASGGDGQWLLTNTAMGGWVLDVLHTYHPGKRLLYPGDGQRRNLSSAGGALPGPVSGELLVASEDGTEAYVFNTQGRHLRTVDALTGASQYLFDYDSFDRLVQVTDGQGNATVLHRDSQGKLLSIVAPGGQETTFVLTPTGYLETITKPDDATIRLSYTDGGLLTQFVDARGNTKFFEYGQFGELLKETDAEGGATLYSRLNSFDGFEVTKTDPLLRTTRYKVQSPGSSKQVREIVLPSGAKTTMVKTPGNGLAVTAPDGTQTLLSRVADPRFGLQLLLPQQQDVVTPGGLASITTQSRMTQLSEPANPLSLSSETDQATVNGRDYERTYQSDGRALNYTTPANREVKATLDAAGRLETVQIAGLSTLTVGYDAKGRLSSLEQGSGGTSRRLAFAYGSDDYLARVTDPLGRSVGLDRDAVGRVIRETLPDGRVVRYGYDENGNLISLTPPGRPAHIFQYDRVDLAEAYTPPDLGPGSEETLYAFGLDKQLTSITRPDGNRLDLHYDAAGRLSGLSFGGSEITYAYEPQSGNVATVSAPGGPQLSYAYDGSLPIQSNWSGAINGTVERAYDNDFRLTSLAINGAGISFSYDADNLLVSAGQLQLTRNATNGLLTNTTLGQVSDQFTYNGFADVTRYEAKYNATTIFSAGYSYDKNGRITSKTETIGGTTETLSYTYDAAGRLSQVEQSGENTVTYTYDANGNRLSGPDLTAAPTYDAQDRLIQYGGASYAYTRNGELLSKTTSSAVTAYEYDVLGNLKSVSLPNGNNIQYVIDGEGRRVGKTINGTSVQSFLYESALRPIAELNGTNAVVSRFVYATRSNVPDYMIKGGTTYRIISDHLGSPRLIVDVATGAIAQRMDYDAFGAVVNDTNPGFQPFGFAGGLFDRDTGLVRFGARDYDAETGRWTAKDPIIFATGDTNLYGYVINDPINFIDLDGNRIRYANDYSRALAAELGGTPLGAQLLGYLEGSQSTFVIDADAALPQNAPAGAAGVFGNLPLERDYLKLPTNMCGGPVEAHIRLFRRRALEAGINSVTNLAHELGHAALFEARVSGRSTYPPYLSPYLKYADTLGGIPDVLIHGHYLGTVVDLFSRPGWAQ